MDVEIEVFSSSEYDDDWPTSGDENSTLRGFIGWLVTKLAEVPAEYRDIATIDISSAASMYGDNAQATLEISYTRPQTEEERAEQIAKQTARAERMRQTEIAAARAVLARYGIKD